MKRIGLIITTLMVLFGSVLVMGMTPGSVAAQEAQWCYDVPAPVHASIHPSNCVPQGSALAMEVYGFWPDEEMGYWITAPDGSIVGTANAVTVGLTGSWIEFVDTTSFGPGLWYVVFQGTSSGHQAIVYFKTLPAQPQPVPQPQPALVLHNQSSQTICFVYMSFSSDPGWGPDWLGDEFILPGESWSLGVSPNQYDLQLQDCAGNVLHEEYNLGIYDRYELTLTD
jgi:hypothetical protein